MDSFLHGRRISVCPVAVAELVLEGLLEVRAGLKNTSA
jgi:hypothetical protein